MQCCVNAFGQANVTPLLPIQNHLELVYCRVQPAPLAENVAVPVPDDFQPALVTVITMLPAEISTAENTLIWPSDPAAKVAVSAAAVVK